MDIARPPALFVADALGLDFLNSLARPTGFAVDWLASGEDLLAWLEQANLISAETAAAMRANTLRGELDGVAEQARAMREWFRGFVGDHKGHPLTPDALDELKLLNRVLERDETFGVIVPRADRMPGFEWQSRRRWRTPDSLLLPIAQAMAELVCSSDFSFIKVCEGPTCTILFLDQTQARARRWCSMALCGNRAKQATHRIRSKRTDDGR
jgi:predicted RNA-binding Zn ribbon-like protein